MKKRREEGRREKHTPNHKPLVSRRRSSHTHARGPSRACLPATLLRHLLFVSPDYVFNILLYLFIYFSSLFDDFLCIFCYLFDSDLLDKFEVCLDTSGEDKLDNV